jgi:hypothetical protein
MSRTVNMTDCLVVFVHEDVVADHLRQETLDCVSYGLRLCPCNVLLFGLGAPKSSSLEALARDRCPSVARAVRVQVRGLDELVDGLAV